jgi:hypothetical protein
MTTCYKLERMSKTSLMHQTSYIAYKTNSPKQMQSNDTHILTEDVTSLLADSESKTFLPGRLESFPI